MIPVPPILRCLARPARAPVAPDVPFVVIGDIHGRDDLLASALERARLPVVCVGDYVDRGPDAAGVLRRLRTTANVTCLMGNHEEMLLDFIDDPTGRGRRWLRHGGVQTLESFGLEGTDFPVESLDRDLVALRDALRAALGTETERWLRALPSVLVSGNVAVVHAAADPDRPVGEQETAVLRWGHRRFPGQCRRDGMWVVHGHVIVEAPTLRDGVASIDTGAWATGRLTLARVSQGAIRFEEA